jgi:hypothetical protein
VKPIIIFAKANEYFYFLGIAHFIPAKKYRDCAKQCSDQFAEICLWLHPGAGFKISVVSGGGVVQSSDGCTVTFSPAQDFVVRARFDFPVTNREGSSWKQTCALLVRES